MFYSKKSRFNIGQLRHRHQLVDNLLRQYQQQLFQQGLHQRDLPQFKSSVLLR